MPGPVNRPLTLSSLVNDHFAILGVTRVLLAALHLSVTNFSFAPLLPSLTCEHMGIFQNFLSLSLQYKVNKRTIGLNTISCT
jgi:hypothetical protein